LIVDPAAGTAGFFICANAYIKTTTHAETHSTGKAKFFGVELVRDTHRLALMNAMLHELEGDIELGDALAADGVDIPAANMIVTNPPFGNKKGAGRAMRSDLQFPTSNKQLAFLQLIYQHLKENGRAAVVLPDNVLFEEGLAAKVRQELMDKCSLHTILRLPTGIFYAQGVKTNVLFFIRTKDNVRSTKNTWIYDLRTNLPVFGKRTPLTPQHFADFVRCYGENPDGSSLRTDQGEEGRFRLFTRELIASRANNLDISWLKHSDAIADSDLPADPSDIIELIRERVQVTMDDLDALALSIDGEEVAS
jgi:type I restriction enzyme M protein